MSNFIILKREIKKRRHGLTNIRILSCFLVVLNKSIKISFYSKKRYFSYSYNYFVAVIKIKNNR
jgi:hypothetical protein